MPVSTRRRTGASLSPKVKKGSTEEQEMKAEDKEAKTISSSSSSSSSSSESSVGEVASTTEPMDQTENKTTVTATKGYSRLFSPYRTLGIVAHGPFHLLPNQNSSNAVVCAAIGERFHMLQCDRLHPVLVSHAVPGPKNGSTSGQEKGHGSQQQYIQHIIADNSLSLTIATHGPRKNPNQVTMFQRTQPIATLSDIIPSKDDWSIVDLLHLGMIKVTIESGEKQGKKENAALCGIVLSKGQPLPDDGVPVMGEDYDGSSSDSSSDESSSDESDTEEPRSNSSCRGRIVLCVASRTSFTLHKQIDMSAFPTFCPRIAVHPPTYLNKVMLGGSCSKTGKDAMILVNVRSGKIIHIFKCLESVMEKSRRAKSEITCLEASPALDTIAVGNSKGMVYLVNTRMDVLLFSLRHVSRNGKPTKITSMSFRSDAAALQYGIAPLAVGRSDGTISIWDLSPPEVSEDEEDHQSGRVLLCEMEQTHFPGGVHKLQYMPQEPLLLSTGTHSNSIVMHIFDNPDHSGRILKERKGHTSSPSCIRYLHPGAGAGGGILVNSADGTDARACSILSGGSDDRTLRVFSSARSVLDKEYSQGKGLAKRARELGMSSKMELLLPPSTALASSEARSRDWGDLITIHKDHAFAYVWSSRRGAQSGPVLRQDNWNVSTMKQAPPTTAHATSVAISTCGNFALVGTKGGKIYKYNVQSGNTRGSYPISNKKNDSNARKEAGDIRRTFKALEKKMKISNRASNLDKEEDDKVFAAELEKRRAEKLESASHSGFAVTGIAVDGVNKTLISVGTDSKLILWNFKTHAPHKKCPIMLPAPATKLCHVRDSDLAAIALADFTVLIFDCSNLTIVRRFGVGGVQTRHSGPITDLGFSPDGRTLYSASLDGTIRVWDVPTNSCIDWLGFKTPPTSLALSPTGEFLATTHTGKLGLSLWSDRSFYQTIHVDGSKNLEIPASMDEPAPIAEVESQEGDHDNALLRILTRVDEQGSIEDEDDKDGRTEIIYAKRKGLITMSGLPPAHWKNLFHLELVKQRNKPKEAPKKPPSAPFFLQWRTGDTSLENSKSKLETETVEKKDDSKDWDAVWSDDDIENEEAAVPGIPPPLQDSKRSREEEPMPVESQLLKKPKVSHFRSHLAALLHQCVDQKSDSSLIFGAVTEHIGSLGPSAIDVSLSTLCNGMHDLEEGLPLLILACRWLTEACESRERFEAINAYLHRFLHLHASVLAGIKDQFERRSQLGEENRTDLKEERNREQALREELMRYVDELRKTQTAAAESLQSKTQNTLCLLRHFTRMI